MKLRGVDFGSALGASGTEGFFGEGYWFHRMPYPFAPRFSGMTFVAKSATLRAHAGNMPLGKNHTPKELLPASIWTNPIQGIVMNAVGLSNPGIYKLLNAGEWQKRTAPFFVSIAPTGESTKERLNECREFAIALRTRVRDCRAPFGIQLNVSCANAKTDYENFAKEVCNMLTVLHPLPVALMPKLDVFVPIETAGRIAEHPACDALCVSNAVPYGAPMRTVDWENDVGAHSPLASYGGGALSGKPLFPLVCDWVYAARRSGINEHINAGGGVFSKKDIVALKDAGASSVFIGSAALLRPWRIAGMIRHAQVVFRDKV